MFVVNISFKEKSLHFSDSAVHKAENDSFFLRLCFPLFLTVVIFGQRCFSRDTAQETKYCDLRAFHFYLSSTRQNHQMRVYAIYARLTAISHKSAGEGTKIPSPV